MQDLIKRYFWVLGALTVIACAFFAAKGAGHFIEAKYLADAKHAPKVTPIAPSVTAAATATRSKEGKPIAERNMFCSDCAPPVPVATAVDTDPSHIQLTSLPLVLIATSVGSAPEQSFGSVVNNSTQQQGAYYPGDVIPGAGPVKEVHYRYLDFQNTTSNRVERISLLGDVPPPPKAVAAVEAPATDENKDDLQAAIDSGIKKIDDSNYEIDRALVDKVLANPMAIAKGARVVPAVKNGKADGFKLYAIRPNSVYSKLGFSNGDTLHSINGFELTSADKALEVYTKLKEANSLQIEVTRRGKPVTINYTIK